MIRRVRPRSATANKLFSCLSTRARGTEEKCPGVIAQVAEIKIYVMAGGNYMAKCQQKIFEIQGLRN